MNTVTTLLHMMISSIILYWNMTYMCIRFPQWSHWSFQYTVSALKKQYEKLHDRSHHTCTSVLYHLYKQYKFVQNYAFDIYTQKLIEKMHMCNADDAKLNFTT